MATPADNYEASQFTLNILGDSDKASEKTPTQFSNASKKTKMQDTDEDGNRMSILPSKKRPIVPSSEIKEVTVKKPRVR